MVRTYTLQTPVSLREIARQLTESAGTITACAETLDELGVAEVKVGGTLKRSMTEIPAFANNTAEAIRELMIKKNVFGRPVDGDDEKKARSPGRPKSPSKKRTKRGQDTS